MGNHYGDNRFDRHDRSALEIRSLNKSLAQFVTKTDCTNDMDAHCGRLEKLEAKVSENSEKLAAIEQYHAMINVPLKK